MRLTEIWYGNVTIDIFQVTWSVTISFQMKFLIWSKHHDTSHRFRALVYVQIRSYTLRYVHYETFCSVKITRHDNDGNSSLLKWKMITIWPQQIRSLLVLEQHRASIYKQKCTNIYFWISSYLNMHFICTCI